MVHTSTSEVYGTAPYVPIDEKHPLQGQSPYSASKIGADMMAESFHLLVRPAVVTMRPFNTFGPRQSARAVIPTILSQILTGGEVQARFADPHARPQLRGRHRRWLHRSRTQPAGRRPHINFGSGREITIGDLAAMISEIVGKEVQIIHGRTALRPSKSEVERLLADNTLAAELLGGLQILPWKRSCNGPSSGSAETPISIRATNTTSKIMKAVILAGGLGTRLKPFTEVIPKPLLPIGEKAVLEIQIEHLRKHGVTEVFLATNYKSNYIENFFGDGSRYGVKLTISREEKRLGTAGPGKLLEKELDEPFIVMNGDIL